MERSASCQNCNLLSPVQDFGSLLNIRGIGKPRAARVRVRGVMRDVALGTLTFFELLLLKVNWKRDVRNAVVSESSSTSQVRNVLYVRGTHDSFIEHSNIYEEFVECHILLRVGSDKVVKLQPGDREYRLIIEFGVVESIQQVYASRARCGDTDSQLSRELGVATCHESGSL